MQGSTQTRCLVALLVLAIGCGSGSEPTPPTPETGNLLVEVVTTGSSLDDSYVLTVGDSILTVSANQSTLFRNLPPGTLALQLADRATNCDNLLSDAASVTITAGDTAEFSFNIDCYTAGEIALTVVTDGATPDQDGYLYGLDDVPAARVGINGTFAIHNVRPSAHVLRFAGFASYCSPLAGDSLLVSLAEGETVNAYLNVSCSVNQKNRIVFLTDSSINSILVNGTDEQVLLKALVSHLRISWPTNRMVINAPPVADPARPGLFGTGTWILNGDGSSYDQIMTSQSGIHFNSPSWDPTGEWLVVSRVVDGSGDANLWTTDVSGNEAGPVATEGDLNVSPVWD